ncbi:hypothetical protein GGR55DRAFT_101467 [Xylaria sp. FL0064]|nr:hypothetical protein GGR55DRAFT_101467 [Xylaria sp. FL0064]
MNLRDYHWTRARDHPPHLRFQHRRFDARRDAQIPRDGYSNPDFEWQECNTCGLTWLATPRGVNHHPPHCASIFAPWGRNWRSLKVCIWGSYNWGSARSAMYFANGSSYNFCRQQRRETTRNEVLLDTLIRTLQIILHRVVPARQRHFSDLLGYEPVEHELVDFRVVIHAASIHFLRLSNIFPTLVRGRRGRTRRLWRPCRRSRAILANQDHYNRINRLLHALATYGISVAWVETRSDQARGLFNAHIPPR